MSDQKDQWFKAKKYGYGWYPNKPAGWLVIIGYCAAVYGLAILTIAKTNPHDSDLAIFIIGTMILTVALVVVGLVKGEVLKWRWGDDDATKRK